MARHVVRAGVQAQPPVFDHNRCGAVLIATEAEQLAIVCRAGGRGGGARQARAASGAWFTASGKPKRRDGTYSVAARRKASKLSAERLDAMLRSV